MSAERTRAHSWGADRAGAQARSVEGVAPPHNPEAEALVIHAAMVVPGFIDRVSPPLLSEHFFVNERRLVFESIVAVFADTGEISAVAVEAHLRATDRYRALADIAQFKIAELYTNTKYVLHESEIGQAVAAAKVVYDLAQRRALATFCQVSIAEMYLGTIESPKAFFESFEAKASAICRAAVRTTEIVEASTAIDRAMKSVFSPNADMGVSSGISGYDDAAGMMLPGEYTLIGGASGDGKTAWGLTVAGNVALRGGGVLYESTEMTAEELMFRLACSWASVSAKRARAKLMSESDWHRLLRAREQFKKLPLHVDHSFGQSVQEIDSQTRRARVAFERSGVKFRLLVVDYVQEVQFLGAAKQAREDQTLVAVSRQLKAIAQKHSVHVLGLVQTWPAAPVAKKGESGGSDGKPDVSSIQGAKQMVKPASTVGFIHRAKVDGRYEPRGPAEIVIRKQRWGDRTSVPVIFDGPCGRFEDDPSQRREECR